MRYDLETDLMPIVKGDVALPNFELMDPAKVCMNLASGGHSLRPEWGYALIDGHKDWAQFFLTGAGMGSPLSDPPSLDGAGYVMIYTNLYGGRTPRVGTFAICRHQKVDDPGANHQRGWHPGKCRLCGMDMTIDSGD